MNRPLHFSACFGIFKMAAAGCLASLGFANALTYHISYLQDEGKRAQITAGMNEAVAVYNATTNITIMRRASASWIATPQGRPPDRSAATWRCPFRFG